MTKRIIAVALAISLWVGPVFAQGLPVIDVAVLAQVLATVKQMIQLVQLAQQTVQQLIATVTALTDLPADLEAQAVALLNTTIQNPLANISGDLNNLLNGVGGTSCGGGMLDANMLYNATAMLTPGGSPTSNGIDWYGSQLNGNATRMSGVLACNQQMLTAITTRLQNMQPLLDRLQSCADVTCATALVGRLQFEAANTQAQGIHMAAMASQAQQMRWIQRDQTDQYVRANDEALVQAAATDTSLAPAAGQPLVATSSNDNTLMFGGN